MEDTQGNLDIPRPNGHNPNGPPLSNGKPNYKKNDNNKNKKPKSLIGKFFKTLFISLGIFVLCSIVVIFGYSMIGDTNPARPGMIEQLGSNLKSGFNITDIFAGIEEHTNVLILGSDKEGTRTDTIILGTFNSKTKAIDLISIPRDTYVYMPEERIDFLLEHGLGGYMRSDGGMKINAVHHHAGEDFGTEFIVKQVEDLLDLKIPYYVKVDYEAFKYLVDEIGGVEFDVPQRMYHDGVEDPELTINLQAGLQLLDGEQALQLVRYRGYTGKVYSDWGRAQTQQDFIKALLLKATSTDDLLSNAEALLSTAFNYVKTNATVVDALKYVKFIKDIDTGSINTHTLPGSDGKIRDIDIVITDEVATAELIDEIFNSTAENSTTNAKSESSIGKDIQILNGSFKSGLAAKNKEFLEDNGFDVESISDYDGTKTEDTRIYVKDKSLGIDIQKLYSKSELIVDKSIAKDYDIVIVLGTDEK